MRAISPDIDLPAMEREILGFWERNQTFQRSNAQRRGKKEFAFYDGPPFANGLPHYGHLLTNSIKDTVPRYWNMRGFFVERRFGWDCHGVPVEYEIEKREGIKGRQDIQGIGIAKFNDMCRNSVVSYVKEWQRIVTRLGRFVDWNNQYRTMDRSFMESVWWVFSELFKKGLVYRDFKVVPYSPRITAVLSNFEANQNYKDVQDPSLTVKFKLVDEDAFLLAWTTTPWTLISNLALCVGPNIAYVKVREKDSGQVYYLAKARLSAMFKSADQYEQLASVFASQLVGRSYVPLFDYFKNQKDSFRVLVDDFVSTEDGTGIVHMAPAYGEDDFRICREAGIELVDPLDDEGRFLPIIEELSGQFVKDADKEIIRTLKGQGAVLKHETIVHSYPYCDRSESPLIYRAIPAWYVAVEKIRDQLVANNQKINWVPEHLCLGRMGKWLEGARDWAVSRNRYWGTPLPIWISENDPSEIRVIGSVAELESLTNVKITDLHKESIDELTFTGKTGTMRRVPEVFDCWFESGSMPYAQIHYPFENRDRFEQIFPADFIAEGLDQTRGWFYTLSVLSTALKGVPPFKNVVVNGIILASDGRKMSKRLKNYTAPEELLDRFGADGVRLYMLNSAILRGEDLAFTDAGVKDTVRAVLLPLWNAQSFLTTYAVAEGWQPAATLARLEPPSVASEMDRWILSRFQTLLERVHTEMEAYHLYSVVPAVLTFIDELTNWYIRICRRRFWGVDVEDGEGEKEKSVHLATDKDRHDAYATLYYVLSGFVRVLAPFAPFIAEKIYQNLVEGLNGVPVSVHLSDMPLANLSLIDSALESQMALVSRVTALGRSLRAKHQIKTRQVLPSIRVITRRASDQAALAQLGWIIREELNVKEVLFSEREADYVRLTLKPNLRILGKKLGKDLNQFRSMLTELSADETKVSMLLASLETTGTCQLMGHELSIDDFLIERHSKGEQLIATESGVTVLLDTKLTPALVMEGLAREVINRVQRLRKDRGLNVSDRIGLSVTVGGDVAPAVVEHFRYIAGETLALDVLLNGKRLQGRGEFEKILSPFEESVDIEGQSCVIKFGIVAPR